MLRVSEHLPSLYTGSFVSEFCFWCLDIKPVLLLLSYCVDKSLFGGGELRRLAFSSAAELVVLVYEALFFSTQVTAQEDGQPQSKQVRRPSGCLVARDQPVTMNMFKTT